MNPRLKSLARQLKVGEQQPTPAPAAGGLTDMFDTYLNQHIEAALERYRARLVPTPVPVPTPQPPALAPAAQPRQMPPARLVRDELGRVTSLVIGDQKLNVIRDGEGRAESLVPAGNAAPTPPTRQQKAVLDYEHSRDAPAPNLGLPTQRHDPAADYERSHR